jgi:cation diffusion facilitator family transporter
MVFGKSITKVRVLQLSFVAITSVVVFEGIVGLATNSLAILGDAAHALFDSLTTLILLITTRIALKPPDEEHMYGHGKIESIGGFVGGIALIGLAGFLFYQAVTRILFTGQNVQHEVVGFWAVGYTLAVDFFRIGTLWGRNNESATVKASFYHALSDFASTIIALFGFGLIFLPGADDRIDAVASIVLSFLLVYLTIGLIRSSGSELSDAIPKNVVTDVRKEIQNAKGVSVCKDLKVRKVGGKTYVETTICVPNSLGLAEAHDVASQIEANIVKSHGDSAVTVHIEPVGEERPIEKEIEALGLSVEGVREVHSISSVYSKGKLYTTLHALVDPKLSVEEAHNIAEKIEKSLRQQIRNLENVTVHIEPVLPKLSREFSVVDDARVQWAIRRIVEAHPDIRRVNRIVTYVSEKRRFVNVDCLFDKNVPVDAMHDTVSQVENEIKKEFKDTVVTIHVEPLHE